MLGVIGFLSAAGAIIAFLWSVKVAFPRLDPTTSHAFTTAFSMLACVMLLSAITLIVGQDTDIRPLILAIDVVMLTATGFLLSILVNLRNPLLLSMLAVIAGLVVSVRAFTLLPESTIDNGILFFNLTGAVRTVFMATILGIWLPAVVLVGKRAAQTMNVPGLENVFMLAYFMLAAITACFFSTSDRRMVIATFGALILVFVGLAVVNLQVARLGKVFAGPKKVKKHARR